MDTEQAEIERIIKDCILIAEQEGEGPVDSYRYYRKWADAKVSIFWSRWYGKGLTVVLRTNPETVVLRYASRQLFKRSLESFRPGCWTEHVGNLARAIRTKQAQAAKLAVMREKESAELAFSPVDDAGLFAKEEAA